MAAAASSSKDNTSGIYQFADPKALEQLSQHQESKILENQERGRKWTIHKEDYEKLFKRLDSLSDQTQYQAMIPIAGNKAFMPGRLENTNEIMVLLGDNWFADRSVKQAREICKRRIQKCDSMLKDLETERKLFFNWRKETINIKGGGSTQEAAAREIREPYDEAAEKQWREEHRQKVKEHMMNKKNALVPDEDEELWKRLDELEIREELEGGGSSSSDSEEDWSESPPLSDEEEESPEILVPSFKHPHTLQRRVSFGGVTHVNLEDEGHNEQPSSSKTTNALIEFSHSSSVNIDLNSQELNPGHLKDLFDAPAPKSILKSFEPSNISLAPDSEEVPSSNFESVREPFVDPVQDKIVEKNPLDEVAKLKEEPKRKPSRFKLSRLNN